MKTEITINGETFKGSNLLSAATKVERSGILANFIDSYSVDINIEGTWGETRPEYQRKHSGGEGINSGAEFYTLMEEEGINIF